MSVDRRYVEDNERECERMRALVARLGDAELRRAVNDDWNVAAALGHVAFWDARASWLAAKIERGEAFSDAEIEPEPPDWINDSIRPFLHALEPRALADLAVRIAAETDRRVAALAPEKVWPNDPASLVNAFRSSHRREHLDEIEEALRRAG